MNEKLTIILGGLTLPDQVQLIETTTPREVDVETEDGSLYTDFEARGFRRTWEVAFPPLCKEDYDAIVAVYRSQYTDEQYLTLVCDAEGIDTVVKANVSSRDIRFNGQRKENFSLTLKEAYAVS